MLLKLYYLNRPKPIIWNEKVGVPIVYEDTLKSIYKKYHNEWKNKAYFYIAKTLIALIVSDPYRFVEKI